MRLARVLFSYEQGVKYNEVVVHKSVIFCIKLVFLGFSYGNV